jgi:hypothetical protein
MDITFASFVTPPGVIAAAAIITGLIQLIKAVFPAIDARVSGAAMAFVGTAVLYGVTAAALGIADANAGLTLFLAWLSCATSAVGIKAVSDHVTTSSEA